MRVVYFGRIEDGFSEESVRKNFAVRFSLSKEKVARLFSGKPVVLKSGLTSERAERFSRRLAKLGASCVVEREDPGGQSSSVHGAVANFTSTRFFFSVQVPSGWNEQVPPVRGDGWVPVVGWRLVLGDPKGDPTITIYAVDEEVITGKESLQMARFDEYGDRKLYSSRDDYLFALKSRFPADRFTVDKENETKIKGQDAVDVLISYVDDGNDRIHRVVTVFAVGFTYRIGLSTPAVAQARCLEAFDGLLASFSLGAAHSLPEPAVDEVAAATGSSDSGSVSEYNRGVEAYVKGDFAAAESHFGHAYSAETSVGTLRMAAAAAQIMAMRQQGKAIRIPDEYASAPEELGVAYIAYVLLGQIQTDGYFGSVHREGEAFHLQIEIHGAEYVISMESAFGAFANSGWRIANGKRIYLGDAESHDPRKEDDAYLLHHLVRVSRGSPPPTKIQGYVAFQAAETSVGATSKAPQAVTAAQTSAREVSQRAPTRRSSSRKPPFWRQKLLLVVASVFLPMLSMALIRLVSLSSEPALDPEPGSPPVSAAPQESSIPEKSGEAGSVPLGGSLRYLPGAKKESRNPLATDRSSDSGSVSGLDKILRSPEDHVGQRFVSRETIRMESGSSNCKFVSNAAMALPEVLANVEKPLKIAISFPMRTAQNTRFFISLSGLDVMREFAREYCLYEVPESARLLYQIARSKQPNHNFEVKLLSISAPRRN